ncbi:MAG: hypothetical protein LBK13_03650 [Spirochaetales bacterium]|jgi:hypothetical protein|nr:hypothetical protein [Spirochaetales bacterium]
MPKRNDPAAAIIFLKEYDMSFTDLPLSFQHFQQNKYIFIVFGLVIAGTIVFNIVRLKKMKPSDKQFLEEHPDAAKVYLGLKTLVVFGAVTVHSVDAEAPALFSEGGKNGFYAVPGKRMVEMTYTSSRPGIIHENVTQTHGPYKKELIIIANKNYLLGFDRGKEIFTFGEI